MQFRWEIKSHYLFVCRTHRRWCAKQEVAEAWEGIRVVGGNGSQPYRALQRLELEQYIYKQHPFSGHKIQAGTMRLKPIRNKQTMPAMAKYHISFSILHTLFFFFRFSFTFSGFRNVDLKLLLVSCSCCLGIDQFVN